MLSGSLCADTIQLRNGQIIFGELTIDEKDLEGFTIRRYKDNARIYIRFDQLMPSDRERLLLPLLKPKFEEELIECLRVVTPSGFYEGLLLKEDSSWLTLKTSYGIRSIRLRNILKREQIKRRIKDVYTPAERVQLLAERISPEDPRGFIQVAEYAMELKLYGHAKEFLQRAFKLTQDRTILEKIETGLLEVEARKLFEAIQEARVNLDFQKALELALTLISGYQNTQVVSSNPQLVAQIKQEQQRYLSEREEYFKERLPREWRNKLFFYLDELVTLPIGKAISEVSKLDRKILDYLATRYKLFKDQIDKYWAKRSSKDRYSACFRSGTWIVLGGATGSDLLDRLGKPRQDERQRGSNLSRPLMTRQQWWETVSGLIKREWLEAYYVWESDYMVKLSQEKKPCYHCQGRGEVKPIRNGKQIRVICPRCHGVGVDLKLIYY
jgi:tetratricopeptide (TPR) repeat protein